MASLMNELLEVLENEEAGYRELVEASTRKKEVIIKADIRALFGRNYCRGTGDCRKDQEH